MIRVLLAALALTSCVQNSAIVPAGTNDGAIDAAIASPAPSTSVVRPGIEVFVANVPAPLKGKRVGLITNASAIDRAREGPTHDARDDWPHLGRSARWATRE